MAEKRPSAAEDQNGSNSPDDRVVYARVDKVVKKAEFVMDVTHLDEYVSASLPNPQLNGPNCINISSDFNADGIVGKITLSEVDSIYRIEYFASLTMDQVAFSLFDIVVLTLICQGQKQLQASLDKAVVRGDRTQSVRGEVEISSEAILKKISPQDTTHTTFRIYFMVKAKVFKQPETQATIDTWGFSDAVKNEV